MITPPSDILQQIIQRKLQEIQAHAVSCSLANLRSIINELPPPRGFINALQKKIATNQPAVIAEIKKASPSKGILRADFYPAQLAQSYTRGGATCLSVLTDLDFFQGCANDLIAARAACDLPVLRKDFLIDPYQIYESRALGADCILLIAACLDDARLHELYALAQDLNLDTLIEVHDQQELTRVLMLQATLIGVNNRDLRTFKINLATSLNLLKNFPSDRILVTESGITTQTDVQLLYTHGIRVFLVGEAFMRAADPGEALAKLFSI